MDPVGPWSTYASYNRLAGVQGSPVTDVHSQLTQSGTPPTTTPQALAGTFIASTPVGYETVYNPLFHPAGSKPQTQYASQVRQTLPQGQPGRTSAKQPTEGEYQGQAYFEPTGGSWQQSSPFGVLPHESIVPTTAAGKSATYENFNAHFVAAQGLNQLNTQLVSTNSKLPTSSVSALKSTSQPNATFFQVPATFPNSEISHNVKTLATNEIPSLQQSCIVTSPSSVSSKDFHSTNAPTTTAFINSSEKSFSDKPNVSQIQTKAQTKIYSDLNNQGDRQRTGLEENHTQSASMNFSVETPGCLNYTNSNTSKRAHFQSSNYRHYQPGNNTESDFSSTKSGVEYNNSNSSDISNISSRRTSPLQAHSQASPLGHAQSPVYQIYNSPMNSVPSPQQTSNNQASSSSPLDATTGRASTQTGGVAYPSVITRTLNNEKKYPDHYDRLPQQQTQDCWDEGQIQHQQRKYQTHATLPTNYTPGNVDLSQRGGDSCQQRNVNNQNQPQAFFNASSSHPVPLQDLASCRGDPISLVKNIQPSQACQIAPQLGAKSASKSSNKQRKSNGKVHQLPNDVPQGSVLADYFAGRMPPPAHSSVTTQQQNGSYFDYDRWNLPSSKMFNSSSLQQQHQGIMMSHPHHPPPPSLPYFPPFHIPPHSDYPPAVEFTPPVYNEQSNQQNLTTQVTEETGQPKVVVPNIEEELEFLSGGTPRTASQSTTAVVGPSTIVNQVGSSDRTSGSAGFMNSYLKFLQGDRDSSPPPMAKGNRKQSWSRSKPVQEVNGALSTPPLVTPFPSNPPQRLSQGDPQDDPRYFPLPKERKKNRFDSSDDGFSSEDDLFNRKVNLMKNEFSNERSFKKGRGRRSGNTNRRGSKKPRSKKEEEYEPNRTSTGTSSNLPRRESSRRAAKEKTNLQKIIAQEELDQLDYVDSDSDPAWSPKYNETDEALTVMKKGRRVKNGGKKRPSLNLITAAAQCAGINDLDGYTSDGKGVNGMRDISNNQLLEQKVSSVITNNITPTIVPQNTLPMIPEESQFKRGEFLVMKTDLEQEWPPIWRVDGKSLLQRYEPFQQNGKTLYKNVQTYTAWTPESIKQYITVRVNFKVQSSTEIIVEFLRKDVVEITIIEKSMEASKIFQDNFEVYIQTLISQALDNNFLTEILQEQDDYFLTNVKTIDDITDNQKHKMLYLLQWPKAVLIALNTWPCFNIINEFNTSSSILKPCAACLKPGVTVRILMFGQPYNLTTLESCLPDPYVEKDFLMCWTCGNQVETINKITHQKYLMYLQCAKKVAEKRISDTNKDTTCILNELLADEAWLAKLFDDVRYLWGEVDSLEYRYRLNNQCGDTGSNKTLL